MKNNQKSLFITIEGGEGVGKSLFIKNFSRELSQKNIPHTTTREPGGTPIAERLRDIFATPPDSDPLLPISELLILSAARAQHIQHKIIPSLAENKWVICDRFIDSTFVYQGTLAGIDIKKIVDPITQAVLGEIKPDLTFLLDCNVDITRKRLDNRKNQTGADRYDIAESKQHEKIRQGFLSLAKAEPRRIVTLDASLPPKKMISQALKIIEERYLDKL